MVMPCKHDVIVMDADVSTTLEPKLKVMAQCDGSDHGVGATGCGWEVEHLDQDGDPHTVGDWWITSDQMAGYVAAHQSFAERRKNKEKP